MAQTAFFTKLEKRGLVSAKGPDAHAFLQNLITNDLDKLEADKALYSCLLTPQGKFLFDFFVTKKDDTYVLECEGGDRAQALYQTLKTYKLRADVALDVEEQIAVYVTSEKIGYADPRHPDLGYRSFEKPDAPERDFADWDRLRISLCIPDGCRDLMVGNSTLEEGRIDILNGVSYEKGCYVGQELTARMHHRGLGKKHLYTVKLDNLPKGAELRSHQDDIGIALVKDENLKA